MRLISSIVLFTILFTFANAKSCTKVDIDLRDLDVNDFIKLISKIEKKNILLEETIKGKVNLISNKKICQEELGDILEYTLSSNGYTLIQAGSIYRVIKIADASKYNLPVVNNEDISQYTQMVTKVYEVEAENVDYVASKIRHFLTNAAKLVTSNLSNTIIITDYPANIDTVTRVIDKINGDNTKEIDFVILNNIKAVDSANELKNVAKSVFNEKVETEKVEVLANKDANSVLLVGKKENVAYLKKYLLTLDDNGAKNGYIVDVVYLKNGEAKDVAKMLQDIVGKKKFIDETEKPLISVDESSNSIVLMGPKREVDYIKDVVGKLDIEKQQVYVRARIVEISMEKARELGMKYGLEGGAVTSNGLLNFGVNIGGSATAVTNTTLLSALTSGLGTSLTQGLLLGVSINMLKNGNAGNVVSEPSILCMNNNESSIYVGETRAIGATSTASSGITTTSYTKEDVGLKLAVKPRISNDNKVTLDVNAILEDISATSAADSAAPANTTKREVKTSAILNDGESIIIGGLTRNKKSTATSGIPLLMDIPLLGWLFKYEKEENIKLNLVIVLTPFIVSKSTDLSEVRAKIEELSALEYQTQKEVEKRLLEMKKEREESEGKSE